ncbi:MAG TPA: sigma-54 dependent transcriptional regulator, partial [Acidobacteriota bacterium]|nr:sigma-54 dependent transcriptional regulator [Acidobacteriota bacterium]
FSVREVDQVIQNVLENRPTVARASEGKSASVEFVFGSLAMERVRNIALQIADTSVPVLITGESGTGKDVVARYIHQQSGLRDQPFVKVNCAAMPAELVESELFGYTKGAFTGAYIDRPGKFEFANGGTIFLDEIGEFTSSVQAKLLQVLQDGRFTRLGSNTELEVEVRVIAATNRKLDEAMKDGTFREDLFYRLNVVNIEIPPLRQRREEIPLFCDFFVRKFAEQYRSNIDSIPESLMTLLMNYHWPGNVRELENLIKRYIVLQDQQSIEKELEAKIAQRQMDDINEVAEHYLQEYQGGKVDLKQISKKAASIVEKNMIKKALRNTQWNKWQAAKELKVSYKTLLNKMEEYSIEMGS